MLWRALALIGATLATAVPWHGRGLTMVMPKAFSFQTHTWVCIGSEGRYDLAGHNLCIVGFNRRRPPQPRLLPRPHPRQLKSELLQPLRFQFSSASISY